MNKPQRIPVRLTVAQIGFIQLVLQGLIDDKLVYDDVLPIIALNLEAFNRAVAEGMPTSVSNLRNAGLPK